MEVTSTSPLEICAEGVDEQPVQDSGGPVRYRTTGLLLLGRSGGKIILLHDQWSPGHGSVIVVADSDQLTWQFSVSDDPPAPAPGSPPASSATC